MVIMPGEIAETGALMPGHSEPVALSRLSPVVHSTTIKHTADNKQNRTERQRSQTTAERVVIRPWDPLAEVCPTIRLWSCFKFFE